MWANAQRDGRPVVYRWRPLFNAAKFGYFEPVERAYGIDVTAFRKL